MSQAFASTPFRFLLLTFSLSWPVWIGGWLICGRPMMISTPGTTVAVYVGSFAPALAAAILSAKQGREDLRRWASTVVRFRCGYRAYAVALLPLPVVMLGLTWLLDYSPKPGSGHGLPPIAYWLTLFPVSIFNGAATVVMGAGPLGEEGGWRGWLLPNLLTRMGEVRASILVGLIWGLWHLPIMVFFPDWRDGTSLTFFLPFYCVGTIALSYILSVVGRMARSSLVPGIWMHGLVNALGGTAFVHELWASPWSQQASTLHSILAFWIVALAILAVDGRRPSKPAGSSGLA